jgi:signal transduction histidine kinase
MVGALNRMLVRLHEGHATELAFAADAGHRLRTPVATLRAEAELALREEDPIEQRAALERVVQDADQLTLIVERMLTRSRARNLAPASVTTVIEDASAHWRRQGALASVNLDFTVGADVSQQARCAGLIEIIDPILDNALRHPPAGGRVATSTFTPDQVTIVG